MILKISPMAIPALCGSLLASGVAIAPMAQAQTQTPTQTPASDVSVTGGTAAGDAAFFAPSTGQTRQNTVLYDAVINQLQLETSIGNTNTARFRPTAGNIQINGNRFPTSGDQGRLQGTLDGVAFTAAGQPVFFQGIPTTLNYTLDTYTPQVLLGGTLVSPVATGTAPLVFLPVGNANVTLTGSTATNFQTDKGVLSAGTFNANLTNGTIQLPTDLTFLATTGAPPQSPVIAQLLRRIKFEFEGENVTPQTGTDLDPAGNQIRLVSTADKFKVQSVGTPGEREFKIEGNVASNLDISVGGPFTKLEITGGLPNNALDLDKYKIEGEARGLVALLSGGVVFDGEARKPTKFKFEQGASKLEGESEGDVAFTIAVSGLTGSSGNPNSSYSFSTSSNNDNNNDQVGTRTFGTVYSSNVRFVRSEVITIAPTTIFPILTSQSRQGLQNTLVSSNFILSSNGFITSNRTNTTYVSVFNSPNAVYTVYAAPKVKVKRSVLRKGNRIIVIQTSKGRKSGKKKIRPIACYAYVGVPSRVFPGMNGLREVTIDSSDEIAVPTDGSGVAIPTSEGLIELSSSDIASIPESDIETVEDNTSTNTSANPNTSTDSNTSTDTSSSTDTTTSTDPATGTGTSTTGN